jgi:N-acetylglucosamine malate deacetylase 2
LSGKIKARRSRSAEVPPVWTSVLAVTAHPDDASYDLGVILDAFILAGATVEVLCLTHRQAWMLSEAPGDIATLRGASVADVLGQVRVKMEDCPDEALGELCQTKLARGVVTTADSFHPGGLLVFDAPPVTGHLDHVSAASVGLLAAETLDLPVLGWTLSEAVAEQLSRECADSFAGHREEQIDLRVAVDRARQRFASRVIEGKAVPGSPPRRRLELLADTQSLRWLRA